MDNRPIGVFDSGIGGLTVLKEIKIVNPNEECIYLKDSENFPYGEKSKEEIIDITRSNIKKLLKQNVKMVVIACGTASSQALDIVKNDFDIPIIGIIEPTVNYIIDLNLDKIGVMATAGTIRSKMWEKSIKYKNPTINVISQACPGLANMVEENKIHTQQSLIAIHKYVEIFKKENIDTIILGCTHYPLYDEIIRNEFEYKINLINTGKYVASEVRNILEKERKMTKNA